MKFHQFLLKESAKDPEVHIAIKLKLWDKIKHMI